MSVLSLLGSSKAKILHLLAAKARTANDIASDLHMQASAARKHLEHLVKLGIVEDEFQTARIGRPKKVYALSEKGREMFPRRYDTILNHLVERLAKVESPSYAESLMKMIGKEIAEKIDDHDLTRDQHASHVLTELNRLGFESSVKRDSKGLTVISRNCPLYKTALAHQEVICRGLHGELLKTSLGARSEERRVGKEGRTGEEPGDDKRYD